MKTMKSSVVSAREFFQLTVNSLLELCTHCIDGHRIIGIEGRLLLTLDTGKKVNLNILQRDVGNLLTPVKADDGNISSSVLTLDVDKKLDGDLPLNAETGFTVENDLELESLDVSPLERSNTAGSADETELQSISADEVDKNISHDESMPTAVLQPNGEFMCSSCGETMKCARAIKRHVSAHITPEFSEPSVPPCLETADKTDDGDKHNVMQKCPKKQVGGFRSSQRPERDSSKQWRSYSCKDCGNAFTSSALLNLHRVQAHRPHQCQKCGTVAIGRRNFSQHVRSEHPGLHIYKAQKSFVCEFCSRTFHNEALLKDHILTIHLGTIEHRCDQCGKVLGSAETLKVHQRQLHERRFQQTCDGCGRQFARLASLINHLTCTHPELLPDKYRSRLDKLVCKECSLTFSRSSSLKRHLQVQHGGAPSHICPICSRRFRCERYIQRHLRNHHPGTTAAAGKLSAVAVDIGNMDSKPVSDILQMSDDSPAL